MSQQDILYSTLLFISAVVALIVSILLWSRRSATGANAMSLLMLGVGWWSGTYALHWTQIYRPYPEFWIDATYLGVVTVPTAFLAFVLRFTHHAAWLTRTVRLLLSVIPCLTLVLMWTDAWHGLFFGGQRNGSGPIINGGPWYWVNLLYSYTLIATGLLLLVRYAIRAAGLYRRQAATVIAGVMAPLLLNVLVIAGANPLPAIDLTPVAFSLTGVILTYGLLQQGILEIIPVARHALVESMPDGVIVVDAQNRLVDINPAALHLFEANLLASPIGQDAGVLLSAWPEAVEHYRNLLETQEEIRIDGEMPGYYDLRISPLYDPHGGFSGRLVVLRDITERKERELQIHQANQRLKKQIVEIEALQAQLREMAIRDSLTGLYNRRYLEEGLERELLQAQRDGAPVSVLMLDIDLFKNFNDTYGHHAGDQVLKALADLLRTHTRGSDIACRYGGEEFVVVLLKAPLENAKRRAEQLRQHVAAMHIPYEEFLFSATVSVGVAVFPQHANQVETLLIAADQALYAAKQRGRNQVAVWGENKSPGSLMVLDP